jgi:hypothetical protein
VVKRCTQALIDCGATGCFIDIEWVKLNNIPTCPLTRPIPVYNVDSTTNDASAITDIVDVILRYETHSEHTQLVVTHLGKQSLILGYNWLCNHNPEINWQTKDVMMSCCPLQCSTCRVEDKRDAKMRKLMTSVLHGYGYTHGFRMGTAMGMGMGTRILTCQIPVPMAVPVTKNLTQ